ncbi:hypothetical protein VL15_37505 [Burkholderia cepacia]|uniref:Uncharacterized protein n=1 Tax=Burkholderia cepacia TaxID=292 RepID=A0A0J5W2I5_BURCE|nr:hypothetical protein VL15_37505 [Burkholderia cepacia]
MALLHADRKLREFFFQTIELFVCLITPAGVIQGGFNVAEIICKFSDICAMCMIVVVPRAASPGYVNVPDMHNELLN